MKILNIDRKFFIIAGASLILLVLVLTTLIVSSKLKTKIISGKSSGTPSSFQQKTNQNSIFPSAKKEQEQPQKILPFPKTQFASWSQAPNPLYQPTSVAIYYFKQIYSQEEVLSLAKKLSLSGNIEQVKDNLLVTEVDEVNNQSSTLIFNTETNNFAYLSTKGIPLPSLPNKTVQEKVNLFLKSLFFDSTLSNAIFYKKKNKPDITYFEIHRDWQKAGLPILNSIGLLNLPEDQPLSTLSIASQTTDIPQDPDIYQSSDNKDGLARQTDFNTITIGVQDKEGKVISLASNLRQLETNKLSLNSLDSFDQAYLRLKNNQSESILTTPSGTGTASFDKVYPGNIAIAKNAIITESFIAYLEQPPTVTQSTLSPYYIFRGYSQLDSGYRVNFIATVPAVETKVLGASDERTLKIGEAGFSAQSPTPFPTPTPTSTPIPAPTSTPIPIPTSTPIPIPTSNPKIVSCTINVANCKNIRTVGEIQVGECNSRSNLYYIPKEGDCNTAECLINILTVLTGEIAGQRKPERIIKEFSSTCPTRITGPSPSLFIYSKRGERLTVIPIKTITYVDPSFNGDNQWNIDDSFSRDYLYYEYQPVKFDRPKEGWFIEKNNLEKFAGKISSQLQLNTKESERLIFELRHATSDVKGNNLFIGLISQEELDRKLPLIITPKPDKIYRYHFYITETKEHQKVKPPLLLPIERFPEMILELGSVGIY